MVKKIQFSKEVDDYIHELIVKAINRAIKDGTYTLLDEDCDNYHELGLPEVMNVADIQAFLQISKNAAYDLVRSGEFHVVKIGRNFKIPRSTFINWFEGKKTGV